MSGDLPPITRSVNDQGAITYHFWADGSWEGFDSLVRYLEKYWKALVSEAVDSVYSRRWVVVVDSTQISIHHDSQLGNYFHKNGQAGRDDLLDQIFADLQKRLS